MNSRGTVSWLLVGLLMLLAFLTACDGSLVVPRSAVEEAVQATVQAQETTQAQATTQAQGTVEAEEASLVVTSTPQPTSEPGVVTEAVSAVAETTNLDEISFLGLTGEDWVNLFISAVAVLVGYLLASWLVRVVLRWLVGRTPTEFDDRFLMRIDRPIRYFVFVVFVDFSISRLTFLSEEAIRLLNNIFFFLYISILIWIAWRLVGFTLEWYQEHMQIKSEEQADRIEKTLPLVGRLLYGTILFIAFIVILGHFNVNMTALLAAVGLVGLALSLAAQDTLNDVINGGLIWLDRPFRIGDRIEIKDEDTWGDVIDIGTRTTRILLPSNSMVIVPNSVIGKGQIINFTYPDPTFRTEVDLWLDYDTDLIKARRVVVEAVRKVDCVLPDKPVEALFRDFGESAVIFRVRWWIDSADDVYLLYDNVNHAILEALRAADIAVAFPKQDLKLKTDVDVAGSMASTPIEDSR